MNINEAMKIFREITNVNNLTIEVAELDDKNNAIIAIYKTENAAIETVVNEYKKLEANKEKLKDKLLKDIERIEAVNEINKEKEIVLDESVKEYAEEILKIIREEE